MARDSARPTAAAQAPARHQLWQLPMFVLGVAALAVVWQFRPVIVPTQNFVAELKSIRACLDAKPPDNDAALARAKALIPNLDRAPQVAGEVYFLLGSAYV